EGYRVARPIGAVTGKPVTSRYQAFEVVNVRRLLLVPRHLVVTAVGVQPGDGERVLAAVVVKEHRTSLRLTRCRACCRGEQCRDQGQSEPGQRRQPSGPAQRGFLGRHNGPPFSLSRPARPGARASPGRAGIQLRSGGTLVALDGGTDTRSELLGSAVTTA